MDGKVTSVPVFIQPDSEQDCLLGSNVLPALGISVVRANGHPLIASSKVLGQNETVGVNLVQATTLPGLNGCFAKAKIDMAGLEDACLLFEPDRKALGDSGVSAFESLISVDSNGYAVVSIHNYQGNCVTLNEGSSLGLVRRSETSGCSQLPVRDVPDYERGSGAVSEDIDRFQKLVEVLGISPNKLSPDQMQELKSLLHDCSDVFALTDQELGCTGIVHHSIDTGEHRPIKQQPYRTAIVRRDTIRQTVNEMQHQGIVQPSRNHWAIPVVLVPKKDGSLCFCVDYRKLNSIMRKDVSPLPRVDDILDTLSGTKFFTSLDLASGYWKIDDARVKSAFATCNGLYEFVRMPFGLCNAPATFQRIMQVVLAGLEGSGVFVYLDDILIASKSFDEHLRQLREVFERLRSAGLRLKPKKCLFLRDEVPYLGHVVRV